jgi:TPR repeat protein
VEQNSEEAVYWFRKAAEQGDALCGEASYVKSIRMLWNQHESNRKTSHNLPMKWLLAQGIKPLH